MTDEQVTAARAKRDFEVSREEAREQKHFERLRMRGMRDHLVIVGFICAFGLTAYGIYRHQYRQVEPGSPEYAEYTERGISVCIRERLKADRTRNHVPTPSEREATCRFLVEKFDRLHPEARPFRH